MVQDNNVGIGAIGGDLETYFATAERTDRRTFAGQVESISNSPIISKLMEATSGLMVVLNENRQIVGLNEAFLNSLGINDPESILGLRLGETLNCIHASELPNGCGTTPHCTTCGAAIATMTAINDDTLTDNTCALTAEKNGEKIDKYLSIQARPFTVDARRWILVFAKDITLEHSLASLENVFYHDFSNILTVLAGSSELLAKRLPDNELADKILNTSKRLCAEVELQRFLSNHKDDSRLLAMKSVFISDIREAVEQIICSHQALQHKNLYQIWPDEEVKIHTDIHLVARVLENMLLNALEATEDGGTVRLVASVIGSEIMWEVWNRAYIQPEVQLRIFQKHFSTKGSMGRGLGTHSLKLLGEKYLRGKISFNSSINEGTTFCFRLPINPA